MRERPLLARCRQLGQRFATEDNWLMHPCFVSRVLLTLSFILCQQAALAVDVVVFPARVDLSNGPEYPKASRRYEEEGTVTLRLRISTDGAVELLGIARGSGYPRLDEAAAAYAGKLRAIPARTADGEAVTTDVMFPLQFQLDPPLPMRDPAIRGWLGIEVIQLSPESATAFFVPPTSLAVRSIQTDSPAARAGLAVGDIILKFNDWPTTTVPSLIRSIWKARPGSTVVFSIFRRGSSLRIPVQVGQSLASAIPYADRVRAVVKPNITLREELPGNPLAEVEVRLATDGSILEARLVTGSGFASWDQAVMEAVQKTERLPLDSDGRIPAHDPGFSPEVVLSASQKLEKSPHDTAAFACATLNLRPFFSLLCFFSSGIASAKYPKSALRKSRRCLTRRRFRQSKLQSRIGHRARGVYGASSESFRGIC